MYKGKEGGGAKRPTKEREKRVVVEGGGKVYGGPHFVNTNGR